MTENSEIRLIKMIQSTKLVKSVLLRSCSEFIFYCRVCWCLLHATHNGKSVTITEKANTKFQLKKTTKRTKMLWKLNLSFSLSVPSFLVFSLPFRDLNFFLLSFFFTNFISDSSFLWTTYIAILNVYVINFYLDFHHNSQFLQPLNN